MTSPVRALWVLGWALLAVSASSLVAERASVTLVLLMVRVLRVVPWAAESPVVSMVMVLPVASILRVLLPVVVGLVCATVIEIKSPRKCFPLSLIVVDAKADLQTKASNGHGQGLSQKLIGFEPVSLLRASSANKHG